MTSLLTRRLPQAAAVLVGRQVLTNAAPFANDHGPLPAPLAAALAAVTTATDGLEAEGDTTPMFLLDRVADRAIGALSRELDARLMLFSGGEHVPLTPAEAAEREAAEFLSAIAFPQGLTFLNLPYGAQFLAMERLVDRLTAAPAVAALQTLRLESGFGRIATIVKAYGEALGIGAAKGAGGIAANDAWHAAYEGLLLQVLATYRNTPHAPAAEAAFALPYTEACDRLRASERKARRAKKDDPNFS